MPQKGSTAVKKNILNAIINVLNIIIDALRREAGRERSLTKGAERARELLARRIIRAGFALTPWRGELLREVYVLGQQGKRNSGALADMFGGVVDYGDTFGKAETWSEPEERELLVY
jgi:hypothetical protein